MSNRSSIASDGFARDGKSEHFETSAGGNSADEQRRLRLSRLIEGEIIPRLLISHTLSSRTLKLASRTTRPDAAQVAELARLMLSPDPELADAFVESFCLRGASRGLICVELLAPTAKYLGELWEKDLCNFTELTHGLQRLESVLKEFRGS